MSFLWLKAFVCIQCIVCKLCEGTVWHSSVVTVKLKSLASESDVYTMAKSMWTADLRPCVLFNHPLQDLVPLCCYYTATLYWRLSTRTHFLKCGEALILGEQAWCAVSDPVCFEGVQWGWFWGCVQDTQVLSFHTRWTVSLGSSLCAQRHCNAGHLGSIEGKL